MDIHKSDEIKSQIYCYQKSVKSVKFDELTDEQIRILGKTVYDYNQNVREYVFYNRKVIYNTVKIHYRQNEFFYEDVPVTINISNEKYTWLGLTNCIGVLNDALPKEIKHYLYNGRKISICWYDYRCYLCVSFDREYDSYISKKLNKLVEEKNYEELAKYSYVNCKYVFNYMKEMVYDFINWFEFMFTLIDN
jgi:hypothetical protein